MNAQDAGFRKNLREIVSGEILLDEPMGLHTSMRAGGQADVVVFPAGREELSGLVKFLRRCEVPFFPVGNGTNLIVRDGGYRGVIVCLTKLGGMALSESGPEQILTASAGTSLRELVALTVREGLSGMEFCAGIPGSVGGALKMNAGAYGREMKDIALSIELINGTGEIKKRQSGDLSFSYRNLDLPQGALIVSGAFRLEAASREAVSKRVREIMELRGSKHPLNFPNSGSIFKNPRGTPAGKLIERCGLKGFRIGDAAVSELHGNFIVNMGKATARDITDLIAKITGDVREKTGFVLETEVKVIGEAN